jgi:N-acetylglucosamine kinase-like BadF-type ATPase
MGRIRTGSILLFLGVDGGATSTRCVVADLCGRVLGVGQAGPVDHLYRPGGRRQTREALRQAVGEALRGSGARRLRAGVAGLTGLEPASPESALATRFLSEAVRAQGAQAEALRVTWDVEVAFAGATVGRPGVMVVAGTGSVAFGRDATGRTARAGGYGFLIDDAGGGVAVGRAALAAALRAQDGRGPATRLEEAVAARLGPWPAIRRAVYGEQGRRVLASLVPLVVQAAQRGDSQAQAILREAGQALAALALAVVRRLDLPRADLYPVGGVFESGPLFLAPLRAALAGAGVPVRLRRPVLPPVLGAVLLAMDLAGVAPPPETVRRLRRARVVKRARAGSPSRADLSSR